MEEIPKEEKQETLSNSKEPEDAHRSALTPEREKDNDSDDDDDEDEGPSNEEGAQALLEAEKETIEAEL